jgi:hypothetical protein
MGDGYSGGSLFRESGETPLDTFKDRVFMASARHFINPYTLIPLQNNSIANEAALKS